MRLPPRRLEPPVVQEAKQPDDQAESESQRSEGRSGDKPEQRRDQTERHHLGRGEDTSGQGTVWRVNPIYFQVKVVIGDQRRAGQQEAAGKASPEDGQRGNSAQSQHLPKQDAHACRDRQLGTEDLDHTPGFPGDADWQLHRKVKGFMTVAAWLKR